MNPAPDDEIGLFEFFETIWDSKNTIGVFVLVTVFAFCSFYECKSPSI